jgi:hypothetical protein
VYARRVFPCVDEPDSKIPWRLTLDVPAGMTAVSNTRLAGTAALPGDRTRYEFERSEPLSCYLVAFWSGRSHQSKGPRRAPAFPCGGSHWRVALPLRRGVMSMGDGLTARIDWNSLAHCAHINRETISSSRAGRHGKGVGLTLARLFATPRASGVCPLFQTRCDE